MRKKKRLGAVMAQQHTLMVLHSLGMKGKSRGAKIGRLPVAIEDTAAQVHTMTVLPSLSPRVCSMKPREDMRTDPANPRGKASHPTRATMVMPVLQLAADSPKHTPAYKSGFACLHSFIVFNKGFGEETW